MLFISGFQATQNRACHHRRPIGQPLTNGGGIDVFHAACVDGDLHTLEKPRWKKAGKDKLTASSF